MCGTVSGADIDEATSNLILGLLPRTKPGSGTGLQFEQLPTSFISHTVRLAHIRLSNLHVDFAVAQRLIGRNRGERGCQIGFMQFA